MLAFLFCPHFCLSLSVSLAVSLSVCLCLSLSLSLCLSLCLSVSLSLSFPFLLPSLWFILQHCSRILLDEADHLRYTERLIDPHLETNHRQAIIKEVGPTAHA